jgi:putative tricarboxylic transport membrane protein
MKPKIKKSDLLAGLLLAAMGGFILYKTIQLDYVNEFGPGPGFLPLWLGIALLILAIIIVVLTVVQPQKEGRKHTWVEPLRGITTWVAFIVAIALVEQLGFLLSFMLLTFFLVWVMNRRSPLVSVTVAVGSAAAFYVVFSWSLGISLPQGPLGF